ncbi:MAG: type IV pilus assembly protein PilM [Pseudolysinimonas sp.]
MGGTVVGVDIGSTSARAVEVQGFDGPKPSIVRYAEVALPESSIRRGEVVEVATVGTALRRLWSTGGFKTKEVVLGMGGSRVFARDLSVPKASMTQIRESLPFIVQDLLPVPVADALLDFYPISEETTDTGPHVSGLLVAAIKDAVNANVSAALGAGLRPVQVDLIPFAMTRAMAPLRSARGRDVLVSIGANTTNVVVADNGVPQFVRILTNGGDDITRAISSRLQWAPEQAEQAKIAVGMGGPMTRQEDRPVLEIVYEVVGELLAGIRSTISYYTTARPTEPLGRILLTGGGSQLTGLPNALGELTGLPVVLADPLASIPTSRNARQRTTRASQDAFTTAFGLALGSHS